MKLWTWFLKWQDILFVLFCAAILWIDREAVIGFWLTRPEVIEPLCLSAIARRAAEIPWWGYFVPPVGLFLFGLSVLHGDAKVFRAARGVAFGAIVGLFLFDSPFTRATVAPNIFLELYKVALAGTIGLIALGILAMLGGYFVSRLLRSPEAAGYKVLSILLTNQLGWLFLLVYTSFIRPNQNAAGLVAVGYIACLVELNIVQLEMDRKYETEDRMAILRRQFDKVMATVIVVAIFLSIAAGVLYLLHRGLIAAC